jgi:hypothetical protein
MQHLKSNQDDASLMFLFGVALDADEGRLIFANASSKDCLKSLLNLLARMLTTDAM